MTNTLNSEHETKLRALVAAGMFDNVEHALASAIEQLVADEDGDLSWAKPLVDEAVAQLDRGERVSHEEVWADVKSMIDGNMIDGKA